MKKIIRLTESDLVRIVKRVISENFNPNQILDFKTVTGYKSALFPQVQYKDDGAGKWIFYFAGSNLLADTLGVSKNSANVQGSTAGGRFQAYQNEYNANDLFGRSAIDAYIPKTTKTKQDVTNIVAKTDFPINNKLSTVVKAGGTYKNKEGKTVTWGRPGFTAANEMVDAICKIMNITA